MNDVAKNSYAGAINRARMGLLLACFLVSATTVVVVLALLRDIFTEIPGRVGDYIQVVGIVLSLTAAGQIAFNEKLLSPVKDFLRAGSEDNSRENRDPLFFAGILLAVWLALGTLLFFIISATVGTGIKYFSAFSLEFVTGLIVSGVFYFILKSDADGSKRVSDGQTVVNSLLKLSLASAVFSLFMWASAGILMGSGFHYIAGMTATKSYVFFIMVISSGALAFPFQYFLFKRVSERLKKPLAEKGASFEKEGFRFPIRYKLTVTTSGMILFAVGVLGCLNYVKSASMLKGQTETMLALALNSSFPENAAMKPENAIEILNSLKRNYGAEAFLIVHGEKDFSCPIPSGYDKLIKAVAAGDEQLIEIYRGENLVVRRKISGDGTIAGLVYPYEKFAPMLDWARNKAINFGIITVLIAAFLSYFASRDISKPVELMRDEAAGFGERNYSWKGEFFADDENTDMFIGFKNMSEEIVRQINNVQTLAENIEIGVRQMGVSASALEAIAQEQAAGSAQQAAAIQETLTTAGEIAATAKQIAENALTVNNVASESSSACENSRKVVTSTIGGIEDVREHVNAVARGTLDLAQFSHKIQGIVDIIEEINDQTHLLSVNASIEASVAGPEGRRFAVLAREIRRLSEGTVEATEQIKSLVERMRKSTTGTVMMAEESTKVVASWAGQVQKLGEAFSVISALVELASNATGEIRVSTQQQTTACEQMAQVIAEVKEVADQVVKSSKETEKSVSSLADLTENLKKLIENKSNEEDMA